MDYECLVLKREHGIATLTLNRPEKLNALSGNMITELRRALEELLENEDMRVVIITGAGRGFCAGADVSGFAEASGKGQSEHSPISNLQQMNTITLLLRGLQKPTIAAVNGACVGAGLGIALACDIRIASENARFSSIFIQRGIIPDSGVTYFLPRTVGTARALELMYTGDLIDASAAERIGLVSQVVPQGKLMDTAQNLARRIAKGPPIAMGLTKRVAYSGIDSSLEAQLEFESRSQMICLETEDHKEGVKAFLEKREAVFRGR
ncbi:MAG: enoyl-CoA hydratase [Chloroflexi bacterium]|nr:enoyl-CoA hydratase [Chloroflexota bacterium]